MGKNDIAVIHYDHVPLNGAMSDLTARFFVRKVTDDKLATVYKVKCYTKVVTGVANGI